MCSTSTSMIAAFRSATCQRTSAFIIRRSYPRSFINNYRMSSTASQKNGQSTISQPGYTLPCPEDVKDLSHHQERNKLFHNPWPSFVDPGGFEIAMKIMQRKITGAAKNPDVTAPTVNVVKPHFLSTRESNGTLRATWLGHASYLVEFPSGLRVVFDPVFEDRCSPLSWLGPKRFTPAPCEIEDIPIIDAVVISHSRLFGPDGVTCTNYHKDHYDHMSYVTLKRLVAKHPGVQFFVPLNIKKW